MKLHARITSMQHLECSQNNLSSFYRKSKSKNGGKSIDALEKHDDDVTSCSPILPIILFVHKQKNVKVRVTQPQKVDPFKRYLKKTERGTYYLPLPHVK